jgi:DNA-binding response OmpR family regulator
LIKQRIPELFIFGITFALNNQRVRNNFNIKNLTKSEYTLRIIMSDKPDSTPKWRKLFSFKNKTRENITVKNVLIVDDEKPFLLSISDGLSAYTEDFHVLTALNGKEAVNILNSQKIDLVITDLKMPKMNGFQLLAYMSKNCADIPVIVMTAFGTPEIESKLHNMGTFRYLEKPLDINILLTSISNALNDKSADGYSQGISLVSFLHLIEMENTTCTIKVKSDSETGYLYFDDGVMINAAADKLKGKAAVMDIINWNNAEIDINFICETKEKNIDLSLNELLAEAFEPQEAKPEAQDETTADTDEKSEAASGEENEEEISEVKAKAEKKSTLNEDGEAWLKAADNAIMATEEEEAQLKAEKDSWLKAAKKAKLKKDDEGTKLKAEEEERLKVEEEAKLKAEEEARVKIEEEERLKAEEEVRLKDEEEAKLKAEEEAILQAEEKEKEKADERERLKAEEEARLKTGQEERLKAEEEKPLKVEEETILETGKEEKLKTGGEQRLTAGEEEKLKTEAKQITRQKLQAWKKP